MLPVQQTSLVESIPTTERIIFLWLSRKAAKTQKAYRQDVTEFLAFCGADLPAVTLSNIIDWQNSLDGLAPATVARKTASIKSLLSFANKAGFLSVNVGAAAETPSIPDDLAERSLTEAEVLRIIDREPKYKNQILLQCLYSCGLRAEELSTLQWKHVKEGQITIHGKGTKTRHLKLSKTFAPVLEDYRETVNDEPQEPVFQSQKGNPISTSQVWRIVKQAGARAGIQGAVSPHWFRHSHATHSLDRGAPPSLVQQQLGHSSLSTTSRYIHARPDATSADFLPL